MNGDKYRTANKEYETVAESSIPSEVHLPSSLLPDLLPSNGKRAGPLYNRQPSKAAVKVESSEYASHRNLATVTENFSRNVSVRDMTYENYASSYGSEKSFKMENGDLEMARKSSTGVEYEQRQNKIDGCPELQTKQLFGQPNVWNLLPYSLHNESTGLTDANAMTYAAALRRSQDKLPERGVNDKSYFNFN